MNDTLHQKPLSNTELSLFCEQLALILSSGISATEGIRILQEEADDPQEKELLTFILEHLDFGESLHAALAASNVFPEYLLHMVEIGEESGTLEDVVSSLSTYYERQDIIRKNLKDSLLYPGFMTAVMVIIVILLLVKIMPIFNQVYQQLGSELSGMSLVLLQAGQLISTYSVLIIVIAVALVLFFLFLLGTNRGKDLRRSFAYRTGISKEIYEQTAAMDFAGSMALMLRSGLTLGHSMELSDALVENPYFSAKIEICKQKMEEGEDFTAALFDADVFSGSYARMLAVGERTGSTDTVLERISEMYQEQIDLLTENRIAKIEPTLVIVMSLIVGCILLSVMLPLLGILSAI